MKLSWNQSSSFLSGYSNVYCHIIFVLDVCHISYEVIGDKIA